MRGILLALAVAALVALTTAYGEHPPYVPMGHVELASLVIAGVCVLMLLRGALREQVRWKAALARVELHLFERGLDGAVPLAGDEFDGLAHRLNELASGHVAPADAPSPPLTEGTVGAAVPAPSATGVTLDVAASHALAEEPEGAYVARVFDEYVTAKRGLGEDVGTLDPNTFTKGLHSNADRQARRLGAARVRFVVRVEDGAVRLEPVVLA